MVKKAHTGKSKNQTGADAMAHELGGTGERTPAAGCGYHTGIPGQNRA